MDDYFCNSVKTGFGTFQYSDQGLETYMNFNVPGWDMCNIHMYPVRTSYNIGSFVGRDTCKIKKNYGHP